MGVALVIRRITVVSGTQGLCPTRQCSSTWPRLMYQDINWLLQPAFFKKKEQEYQSASITERVKFYSVKLLFLEWVDVFVLCHKIYLRAAVRQFWISLQEITHIYYISTTGGRTPCFTNACFDMQHKGRWSNRGPLADTSQLTLLLPLSVFFRYHPPLLTIRYSILALAWKIPWMEEPGRLQSLGSLRVGYDWATSLSLFTFMHWRRKWQPTPVFLPRESQRQCSLVGCRLWGRTELDTTEVT